MQLPFEAEVALRYLRSQRKGSLITLITIGGVAVGVAALTVVTSVWNGFEAEFLEKLLGVNAHALLLRSGDVFRDHRAVAERLRAQPGITYVQPFVYSEVIVQSARGVSGVVVKGVDPTLARGTSLAKYVDPRAIDALARPTTSTAGAARPGVLIGHELAQTLKAEVGEAITLISPQGGQGAAPRTESFELVGVFHSGMFEFDARMVFVELAAAQRYFRLHDTITALEVWSADPTRSAELIGAAAATLDPADPAGYEVRDWSRTNRSLFGAVRSQKVLISLILGFIVLVASFNIIATLFLLILEKQREIAVLKSLGASDRSILWIFFIDGQLVGLAGALAGVLVGLALCGLLSAYGLKLDPRVYYLENLPIVVRPLEVLLVSLGAVLAATVATLVPAGLAARLPPVDGLRQGGTLRNAGGDGARTYT